MVTEAGGEFQGEPVHLDTGERLHIGIEPVSRTFQIGEEVRLDEEDVENIASTMIRNIGPALLNAAFPPNPRGGVAVERDIPSTVTTTHFEVLLMPVEGPSSDS